MLHEILSIKLCRCFVFFVILLFSKSDVTSSCFFKPVTCKTCEIIDERMIWLLHQRWRAANEFVKCNMPCSLLAASALMVCSNVRSTGSGEKDLSVRLIPNDQILLLNLDEFHQLDRGCNDILKATSHNLADKERKTNSLSLVKYLWTRQNSLFLCLHWIINNIQSKWYKLCKTEQFYHVLQSMFLPYTLHIFQ